MIASCSTLPFPVIWIAKRRRTLITAIPILFRDSLGFVPHVAVADSVYLRTITLRTDRYLDHYQLSISSCVVEPAIDSIAVSVINKRSGASILTQPSKKNTAVGGETVVIVTIYTSRLISSSRFRSPLGSRISVIRTSTNACSSADRSGRGPSSAPSMAACV